MKKTFSLILVAVVALAVSTTTFATQNRIPATSQGGAGVVIPEHAVDNAHGIYYLGTAIDPESGQMVEGYAVFNHKDGHTPGGGGGNGKPGGDTGGTTSSCYEFLAKDAKWKTVEPWVMNPANTQGLSETEVFDLIANGIDKWEDAADGNVDGNMSVDILGNGSSTSATLFADTASPDGVNEVYFGSIDNPGTIGVTIVWGIFGGPPQGRELVEWDQVYDQDDFAWATDGDPTKMDFDSIGTHELGHSVGLADLYTSECVDETMYGYGAEGETKARDLNSGDITGVSKLY